MVVIRHLSGSLAGSEQSVAEDREQILFGRDPEACDVIYPPDDVIVGRRHFALIRKPSGDWAVDLFGDHYVEIDGIPADPGQAVPSGGKLRLGGRDGPSFEFIAQPVAHAAGLALTATQTKPPPVRLLVRRDVRALLALLLIVVAGTAGWIYLDWKEKDEAARRIALLFERQSKLEAEQERADAERIGNEARARLARAAFLVVLRDEQGREMGTGTAWPVAPSILATNAHVAEIRDSLRQGEKMLVRAPGPDGAVYDVAEHQIHPGYRDMPEFVKGRDPAWVASYRGRVPRRLEAGLAYDVALLRITGEVPPDAILQIAGEEELKTLAPGLPLASAGYPTEQIARSFMQPIGATPQVHFGNVSALTDYFGLPTEVAQRRLVHHTIGTTGGSSGSAIIAPSGRVVALVNAGSFVFLKAKEWGGETEQNIRIPSGALVNYAQRADIVTDLLLGREKTALADDQRYWERQLANFKRGIDVIVPWMLERLRPKAGATAQVVSEEKATLQAGDRRTESGKTHRVKQHKVSLRGGVAHVLFAYAERETNISLALIGPNDRVIAQNTRGFWYPSLTYRPPADESVFLYVSGPDEEDTTYTLRVYTWRMPES